MSLHRTAVANPCFQKEWDEWTEVKNERRRRRRRWTEERGSRRAKVEVNGEDGGEVEEEEDTGREEVNEAGRKGEDGEKVKMEAIVNEEVEELEVRGSQEGIDGEQWEEEEEEEEVEMNVDEEEEDTKEAKWRRERDGTVDEADGNEEEGKKAEEMEKKEGEMEVDEQEDGEEPRGNEAEIEVWVDKVQREVRGSRDGLDEEEEETKEGERELSDSAKSGHEDLDWKGSDPELDDDDDDSEEHRVDPKDLDDSRETSIPTESSVGEAWTSTGEDASERPLDEEDFLDCEEEEEDSADDDEEAEHSPHDDSVDSGDEGAAMKMFHKDDYPADIFRTLTDFKDSSLLTDLSIRTNDGKTLQVHSLVLAAVSALIWQTLRRRVIDIDRADRPGRWVLRLGPDVDRVGLEAIVEFAYSGRVSPLNEDTVERIKAAAQTLGAHRVMDVCSEEEGEGSANAGEKKTKREERISAEEQMRISLRSIRQMWTDGLGCDVFLEGIGKSLHVHRIILAASSDYFRGMFTLGMKESHQPRVNLPFLLSSELETLIGCSYSGALSLSWRCVFELTGTALQLQYRPALSLCLGFLQREIDPQSCLDVASFAAAYEMPQLLEVADDYVLRQFQKVACTSKFKDLPARQLLKYLKSRSLCVPSELVVFKAVVAWIQAKPRTRIRLTKEFMKTIHFSLMTFKEFKEVQSLDMWSEHGLDELYQTLLESFCSNEAAAHSQYRTYLPKESLVLIGGDHITEDFGGRIISRELWFGNSLRNHTGVKKALEWRRLGEMPEPARFSHEVAVVNGRLYVFGGKKYYGLYDTLNSVLRYDPSENIWESLPEMQQKRCFFSVVVLDGQIYAIGGHCHPECRDSVERYCPATNSWRFTRPLDLPLTGHVARVSQGQIFISGGMNDDWCLATTFRYHPETGSVHLANMTRPRAYHCMEALGGCLYVAGGNSVDDRTTIVDELTCESFSLAANAWTTFMSLPVPHVGAGSAVLEGKFYVLGGYSQDDYSDTKTVHRYDPATQRWENMGKMPGPNNDIRASVLSLPQRLRS